jgi:uncharacterized protein YaiE (UPF0345 family)
MVFQIVQLKFRIPIALVILVLVTVIPVSATLFNGYYRVAPEIEQGASVFIGEQGLNITPALDAANAQGTPTSITTIGWWASAAEIRTTAPTASVETLDREKDFTVTQAEFEGYDGTWYLVDPTDHNYAKENTAAVFNVRTPVLTISIRDVNQNYADVSGMSIPTGTKLKFQIGTNMYTVLSGLRSPVYGNAAGEGYLYIIVRNGSGPTILKLYGDNDGLHNLTSLNVSTQPYLWGEDFVWNTSACNPSGEEAYPPGTYVVFVMSRLNNMYDNYLSGGAAYTGRTVSETKTITLVPETVSIVANKDSVVRTNPFSVTITGFPSTWYNVWVRNTRNMNINTFDGAPPIITKFQMNVLDGNVSTYNYLYQNGSGTDTVGMNAYGQSDVWFQNASYVYSYASIKTSTAGTGTVEFSTTHNTKAQMYTVRVERNLNDNNYAQGDFRGDEVNVNVEKDAVTPSKIGIFRPSAHTFYLKNGTTTTAINWGVSTDLPVTGDWNSDGRTDVGMFRPSAHTFYLKNGTTTTAINWGVSTDLPVTGDWNGDRRTDVGVFRNSTHMFYLKNGTTTMTINWGTSTDLPVTGDWNGDGRTEVGVFRPSVHTFYLKNGTTTTAISWGIKTDLPVTGDWNGDRRTDVGVFRPSVHTFYLKNGTTTTAINWGTSTDKPVTGKW